MRWALVLIAAAVTAQDIVIDWLPPAAFTGEIVAVRLRSTQPLAAGSGSVTRDPDGWHAWSQDVPAGTPLTAPLAIAWRNPGTGPALVWDGQRLRAGDAPAVLVCAKRIPAADRRWQFLRGPEQARQPQPCDLLLRIDEPALGKPALPLLLVAAQRADPAGKAVLLRLPDADRDAGWGDGLHYLRLLAWMIEDLQRRGATHVQVVGPHAPQVAQHALAGVIAAIGEACAAWGAATTPDADLSDHALWETAPGVLGTTLNGRGQEQEAALLRRWSK